MSIKLRFAITKDGTRVEPQRDVEAFCPVCNKPLVAKLGLVNAHHWAHKNGVKCTDTWLSPETKWHSNWKNKFPKEWQEIRCKDNETGEIHIADVKTTSGFVIEFQHSPIELEEIESRENFYKDMLWVIDLGKPGYRNLLTSKKIKGEPDNLGFRCTNLNELIPPEWINRKSIICLDYLGNSELYEFRPIYCLIPTGFKDATYVYKLGREEFITGIVNNKLVIDLKERKEKVQEPFRFSQALKALNENGIHLNQLNQSTNKQPQSRTYSQSKLQKIKTIQNYYKKTKS